MTQETASYVRLVSGYYSRPDYFTADVTKGTIRTPAGTRICALTDDFLRGFRTAVQFECGKATDRVYKRCGFRWGTSFVERFDREMTEYFGVPAREVSAGLVERALDEAFRAHGYGRLAVDYAEYDHGFIQVTLTDSVMPAVVGRADKPTDALMCGFFAAVFGFYANAELDCAQTQCPSRGAESSRFLVGLASRLTPVPKLVADNLTHATILTRLKAQPASEAQPR